MEIKIIGGGLAGAEAAYQIASLGGKALLYEMRPGVRTPAHRTDDLAELVCSNSLKSQEMTNAHGLLKAELRLLGSLILAAAEGTAIAGGKALVVDRGRFGAAVTSAVLGHPAIRVVRKEVTEIFEDGIVIVATGPLTSPALTRRIRGLTGKGSLYFFDAISPIVDGATIDRSRAFFGSRYGSDRDDYLNCPLSEDEYERFYEALLGASRVDLREFEADTSYFEGCLPIEVMAERGKKTLVYGPMKPVGLADRSGKRPYAVVQLRREDEGGSMYNMVGFQTKLTYGEQERVFRLVPALEKARFFRLGSIHRNTFIDAPTVLCGLQLKTDGRIFFAGQITGVEGYMESTAMGLLAGIAALCSERGIPFRPPEPSTCIGALYQYISTKRKDFQPMNINFGLVEGYDKREKERVAERALAGIAGWRDKVRADLASA